MISKKTYNQSAQYALTRPTPHLRFAAVAAKRYMDAIPFILRDTTYFYLRPTNLGVVQDSEVSAIVKANPDGKILHECYFLKNEENM